MLTTPSASDVIVAINLPQPLIGAVAVGIPLLIIAVFFVFWDRPPRQK